MMKPSFLSLLTIGFALAVSGCAKEDPFVYYSNQTDLKVTRVVKVKEVLGASGVDVLWVVDNSISMSTPQKSVITNAGIFMNEFAKAGIDWKLGLISTDTSDRAYLGFGQSVFNHRTPDLVQVFISAMERLGLDGDMTEKSFSPILKHLRENPDFSRPSIPKAVIMVTDAPEQSVMPTADFIADFKTLIGKDTNYYAYGVFGAEDLNCATADTTWNYAGSRYEEFVLSAKSGKIYPICAKDYGTALADMGHVIAQNVSRSSIYLSSRPEPKTIRVNYRGVDLPGGLEELGAYWYYDTALNSVVFYSLDFSHELEDSVSISYDRFGGTH